MAAEIEEGNFAERRSSLATRLRDVSERRDS